MSRTFRNADFKNCDNDKPERADDGYPKTMGSDHEECMDKIFSDPLLEMIASSDADGTPQGEASRKYIAEYLKKYHLLGVVECSSCGEVNYEGDQHCSRCGGSLVNRIQTKLSLG